MARSELIREFEKLMEKVKIQKGILVGKIESVDHKQAAVDDSLYESFMPTIDAFQEDLSIMLGTISNEIQDMGDKIIAMIDGIEEADKLPPEEGAGEDDSGDEEDTKFSPEEVETYEKEAEAEESAEKESNKE